MPTPYGNIFSGLSEGLQQGFSMGLARRQQQIAEQEHAQKIEMEKQKALKEAIFKGLDTGQNLMKIKHPAIRQKGLDITIKTIRDNADFFGIDPASLPETINWTDSFDPVVKEIDEGMKAYKEGRIDDATALGALNSSLMKAKEIMDSEDVETLRKNKEAELKAMQGEKESSMLQQAAMIPSLTQQGVLSPEEAQAGQLTALAGAGTKGQEILAAEMKQEDKTEYKERDLPLKGDMEQKQFSLDGGRTWQNLGSPSKKGGVRDTYADEQVRNRMVTNFNADPNVRRFGQMENFANIINEAASGDNPIAHASIPTLMARAVGEVGALTEADKKPFGGSTALISRLEQVLTQLASGKRTPENIKLLQDLSDTLIRGSQRNKAKIARERAKQYVRAYKGKFSEEDIFNMLSPESVEPMVSPVETPKRRSTDKNSDPLGLR